MPKVEENTDTNIAAKSKLTLSRKQLAWMGLFFGSMLVVALNIDSIFYSIVDELAIALFSRSNMNFGVVVINLGLSIMVWVSRVKIGQLFSILFGWIFNAIAAFIKRV